MINFFLLITSICIVIALLLYLFYWNRFIGFLLSLAFRVLDWNQDASSVWVDIGSIHFSILAGRILLKDLRYHSSNQTVKIVKAQIAWRYWIRRPTTEDDLSQSRIGGDDKCVSNSSSCRIKVSVQGFEWFLYNRTAAYDNIVNQMNVNNFSQPTSRVASTEPKPSKSRPLYPPSMLAVNINVPHFLRRCMQWVKKQLPRLDPKELLPIGIEVAKGAIVCGNASTSSLLVSEFHRAVGSFGIVPARSKCDLYKQILSLKFQNALIRYVENEDFQNPMTTTGQAVQEAIKKSKFAERQSSNLTFSAFAKLWRSLKLSSIVSRVRTGRFFSHANTHMGSLRNRKKSRNPADEDTPLGPESAKLEYAVARKILETPLLELAYYADVVGEVPRDNVPKTASLDPFDIGNGGLSPEWGIDIVIRSGFVRYGPWADRQRVELQRAFFPTTFHHIEPTERLQPGDSRLWTSLKVFIELRDDTTLHIPFREASKNWQWDGKSNVPHRPRKREPGYFHVIAGDSSSINYVMPMIASSTGYEARLEVHLDNISVTSSLNDITLLAAESCRVRSELPSPLRWNSERLWTIAVSLRQPVLYLLRDHINMFTDLAKDWTSGSPSNYSTFVPIIYIFELELHHFDLNLYVNDHNIIDKPLIKDENALFSFKGPSLHSAARIPSNTFRPQSSVIPFTVDIPDLAIYLSLPRWNTHSLNVAKLNNKISRITDLRLGASYLYYAEVKEGNVEQLKLDISAREVAFKAVGWSIRHLMILRENYIGSFTHFSTLFEYLDKRKTGLIPGDPIVLKYREGTANMLQVELAVVTGKWHVLMPAGLPSQARQRRAHDINNPSLGPSVVMTLPEFQLSMRTHDFFMEMVLNIDTISGHILQDCLEDTFYRYDACHDTKELFLIDGIHIVANRLFGPQPRTLTYLCLWEIRLGHVKAVLSISEEKLLQGAVNAFRHHFSDSLNAPAAEYQNPPDPDVTVLKFSMDSLNWTWLADTAAFEFSLPRGLRIDSNDLAGAMYRKVTSLRLPIASSRILFFARKAWSEVASFTMDGNLDVYSSPHDWRQTALAQAQFVETQDRLTGRAKHIFQGSSGDIFRYIGDTHRNGVYLPQPHVPALTKTERDRNPLTHGQNLGVLLELHTSDSEEDKLLSESDRDARLAKTRSMAQLVMPVNDEEQNMTSGDESDDEDLTDAQTSDGDWFEEDDATSSSLAQYRRWMKQFMASNIEQPSVWNGSPFVLTRECKHLTPSRGTISDTAKSIQDWRLFAVESEDEIDATVYRFRSEKGIDIKVFPPVMLAAARFEEAMELNALSPELCLDEIILNYISDLSASHDRRRSTVLDVKLSSVHLQLLQCVGVPNDDLPDLPSPGFQESPTRSQESIIILDVSFNGWNTIGQMVQNGSAIPERSNIATFINSFAVTLDVIPPGSRGTESRHNVFCYFLYGFQSESFEGRLAIELDSFEVEIEQLGPAYASATGTELARVITHLMHLKQKWAARNSSFIQKTIYHILTSSNTKSIVDPLSTIQPSYLVQSGRPNKLRTDVTFKFLFHLRDCLWHLDDLESQTLVSSTNEACTSEELEALIAMRLTSLAVDADTSLNVNATTLHALLPSLYQSPNRQRKSRMKPFTTLSLDIRKITVQARGVSSVPASDFLLSPLVVVARTQASELILTSISHPPIFSQSSLREKDPRTIRHLSASISVGDMILNMSPHLMGFTQQLLRIRRHYASTHHTSSHSKDNVRDSLTIYGDLTVSLHHLCVRAAAERLAFEAGSNGLTFSSTTFLRPISRLWDQSSNHTLLFEDMFIRAKSPGEIGKEMEMDVLASLVLSGGKANAVIRQEPLSTVIFRAVWSLGKIHFNVPRSAMRLYRFIEEWRADFLPGINAMLQALLSEAQKTTPKSLSPTPSRSAQQKLPMFQIHGFIASATVSLQVMHGTWLSWEVYNAIMYHKSSKIPPRSSKQSFGLQVASQIFTISPKPLHSDTTSTTQITFEFPKVSLEGRYDGFYVQALTSIDYFCVMVKPTHWDTLLAVQQKFGQDFNDLVVLIDETRRNATGSLSERRALKSSSLKYSGHLKMRGFKIGLEGLSSIMYLDCDDISGGINNDDGLVANVKLVNLALSLASRAQVDPRDAFSRSHRSAFVIIDLFIRGSEKNSSHQDGRLLDIGVTKLHAVMQPSSIGEVGDYIDYMQAELLERKEQRALQLAAFKEKTQNVMKTFEIDIGEEHFQDKPSWLNSFTVNVSIRNFGAAFPLALNQDLQLPQRTSTDSRVVRAFLWSIKSIIFSTQGGETGQVTMENFSFQFVSGFKQSDPVGFTGENHETRNRLLYPQMTAQLRSQTSASSRQIWVGANVSGFILDLDSSIPDYVFSLTDVYRQGTERVTRLTASLPRNSPSTEFPPHRMANVERKYTAVPTSNILASLTFLSGKVRLHSSYHNSNSPRPKTSRSMSISIYETTDEHILETEAEIFKLPVVSVWTEYRATPASYKIGTSRDSEPSILMFKGTIHSSQNTLRPTLLPFLTEIVDHVEVRLRQASKRNSRSSSLPVAGTVFPAPSATTDDVPEQVSSMQISFSLRIDQSKLELTCQPDVNVIGGLHWDSGGFVVNVHPGARKVTFTGSVGGLTAGLKHGFLSEDCVRLDARNLAFSATFAKLEGQEERAVSFVSLVLDTEFSGGVRFSRLQDVLCFKAVWLDRIPIFSSHNATPTRTPAKSNATVSSTTPSQSQQEFTTAVLLRIRHIKLDIDLGQSISAVVLDLKDALIRTKITEAYHAVSLSVVNVSMQAKGNISGRACVPNCVFQTIRKTGSNPLEEGGAAKMLALHMTSGALEVDLESDHQKLLLYRAEPLLVQIFDDWSDISPRVHMEERPLRLAFTVSGTEVVTLSTVGTIPKLLAYAKKFTNNLEHQKEGAARESKAFRITRSPKPDNPLSAVANAMIRSARIRFKEAETGLTYIIRQHMSLRLDLLRIVVFPRTMTDPEMAQFIGRNVHARLDRLVKADGPPARDLHLSFSNMTISKFSQLVPNLTAGSASSDDKEWLASLLKDAPEAIIVGLPSMNMHMFSEAVSDELSETLLYDFDSRFVRREGMKNMEDIYITLNVGLYSWLTVLKKNLTREMDQVQASTDWRTISTAGSGLPPRKKVVDLIQPFDMARSGAAAAAAIPRSPPLSPSTSGSLYPTPMVQSKSASPSHTPADISPKQPFVESTLLPSSSPQSAASTTPQLPSKFPFPGQGTTAASGSKSPGIIYQPRDRHIERLTMRQLGDATPDVMHPFFMKKAGFNLEDSLPQYVHEYATMPLEGIMEVLLKLYSKQLLAKNDVNVLDTP